MKYIKHILFVICFGVVYNYLQYSQSNIFWKGAVFAFCLSYLCMFIWVYADRPNARIEIKEHTGIPERNLNLTLDHDKTSQYIIKLMDRKPTMICPNCGRQAIFRVNTLGMEDFCYLCMNCRALLKVDM